MSVDKSSLNCLRTDTNLKFYSFLSISQAIIFNGLLLCCPQTTLSYWNQQEFAISLDRARVQAALWIFSLIFLEFQTLIKRYFSMSCCSTSAFHCSLAIKSKTPLILFLVWISTEQADSSSPMYPIYFSRKSQPAGLFLAQYNAFLVTAHHIK